MPRKSILALPLLTLASAGYAQQPAEPVEAEPVEATIVVTGTRFTGRTITTSPVPIDVVPGDELRRPGYTQLSDLLRVQIPSFTTPRPSTAGAVDFYTAPSLRGLSPGAVARACQRQAASSDRRSEQPQPDRSRRRGLRPERHSCRRDRQARGAARRGGGAISIGLDAGLTLGITERGDGRTADARLGYGVAIGDGGFLRVSGQFRTSEGTDRALPDTRQQYFGSNGTRLPSNFFGSGIGLTPAAGTLDPREATVDRNRFKLGEPEAHQLSGFFNAALPIGEAELYSFGGFSRLRGESIGFVRRAGQDETVRALHPDGYAPIADATLQNFSIVGGVRGRTLAAIRYDVSTSYGGSRIDITQRNSNNPSFGAASPRQSYRGGIRFEQWTTNLDLTRDVVLGLSEPLKVAAGAEYREERYQLVAGDTASFTNGGVPILDGPNAGRPAPIRFQTTAGTRPTETRPRSRNSKAVYLEIEQQLGPLLLSGALRHEDFSDFGSTTNYKLAARLELAQWLALRGSLGTGFRAPNLAQSFFSTTSNSVINGQLTSLRLLPVDDPAARLLGAADLKPEKSRSYSIGATFARDGLNLSIDLYRIAVDDRIALSSTFQDARVTTLLAANGFPGIAAASYLTNAVDTTGQGIDVALRYVFAAGDFGRFTATLAANYNEQRFRRIAPTPAPLAALGIRTPLFDLTQQVRFTDSLPRDKQVLDLNWTRGKASVTLSAVRYGATKSVAFTSLTPAQIAVLTPGFDVELRPTDPAGANSQVIQRFRPEVVVDLQASWQLTDRLSFGGGVTNLFDNYPDLNIASTAAGVAAGTNGADNAGIFPYNYISPFGYNGRAYFLRLGYRY
jgi:iron complex outermembrane recepter protein